MRKKKTSTTDERAHAAAGVTLDQAPLSRDELVALVDGAHTTGAHADRAGDELMRRSRLPRHIAVQLGTGYGPLYPGWPSSEQIVDFALAFVPPTSVDEVWRLARVWAEETAEGRTVLANFGPELLREALAQVSVPELAELLAARTDARSRLLRERLGLAVSPLAEPPQPPTTTPPAPPKPPLEARHPKFGLGQVVERSGEGPDATLTIAFADGTRKLKASFVELLETETEVPR